MKEIYGSIIKHFDEMDISSKMYWVGPVEGAEMQNGILFENGRWTVYYRERGMILNREDYDSQEEAVAALEKRLRRLIDYYQSIR